MDKIRTAVIGVGHLGRHHARWYKNIKEAELIGIYDIDSDKCRQVADELQVRAFEDLSKIPGTVEAVSIAVPTRLHHDVASEMLSAGIHCLVEKPIAATVAQAESLLELAHRKKCVLAVGHIEHFNPAIVALERFDVNPRFIEAHRLAAFDPRGTDVAVILDLMIHDIELALHLIKSPVKEIDASAVAVISDTADIANARLTFDNGAVANLTASRISLHQMRKLRIFQKSGYFSLDLAERRADIYRLSDDSAGKEPGMRFPLGKSGRDVIYHKIGADDRDMLQMELLDFLDCIRAGAAPAVTGAAATEALRVAAEIERIGLLGQDG